MVIVGSSIATLVGLALCAVAQSTPPAGVTVPPTAPDTIEQTIPKPTELPSPLPFESPPSPPKPNLQTPSNPQPPEVTSPQGDRFKVRTVEVLGSTVLQKQIA